MEDKYVLIADDDHDFCELISAFLEERGYRSCVVHDTDEVMKKVGEEEFNIVLLDLKMPGFAGGFKAYHDIKDKNPLLPVIIMTGCAPAEVKKPVEDYKIKDIFYKPFKMEELITRMNELVI